MQAKRCSTKTSDATRLASERAGCWALAQRPDAAVLRDGGIGSVAAFEVGLQRVGSVAKVSPTDRSHPRPEGQALASTRRHKRASLPCRLTFEHRSRCNRARWRWKTLPSVGDARIRSVSRSCSDHTTEHTDGPEGD